MNFSCFFPLCKIRLFIIFKTPSSVQNSHRVNQNCTLPVDVGNIFHCILHDICIVDHWHIRMFHVPYILVGCVCPCIHSCPWDKNNHHRTSHHYKYIRQWYSPRHICCILHVRNKPHFSLHHIQDTEIWQLFNRPVQGSWSRSFFEGDLKRIWSNSFFMRFRYLKNTFQL